ncbi:TRAP transporter permease [Salinarimonas rosea]|uniref:TRAP transporter permease n=1 Tax=Salinarimonas rosea TaxID=552063 RepID=UPI0003F9D912|nr:TRAP transporter fused permease subunit [Salinarimonas rosea]
MTDDAPAPRLDPAADDRTRDKPVVAAGVGEVKDVEGEVEAHVRSFEGTTIGRVAWAVGIALALYHIWTNTIGTFNQVWLTAIHFAGFAFLCALRYPFLRTRTPAASRAMLAFDVVFGLVVAVSTLWLISNQNAIYDRGVRLSTLDTILAFIVIGGAIDLTRRATGFIIPVLILVALTYVVWWGPSAPGVFRFAGLSTETLLFRSIFSDEGMFGSIALISATFVFLFILFGAFLVRSGAGEFIIDLARAVAGRFVGGPGFVAVMSSGLTGTISGSAVANTVSTGVITIPLMKRAGFPPKFAAGVEAAASTGGGLMPPIMGAGAFVMATYTQISYLEIAAVSLAPAIVYFLSVAFFVRIEAKKHNLVANDPDAPSAWTVLKKGGPSFLIPVAVLIGLLIAGYTPVYAAGFAILACIAASWLTPNRMGPKAILDALALGAQNMIMTAVLLVAVGLVINVIAMTGVGNTFSLMINEWAGNSLIIALALIALASLVLGMGLPVTASYIVLATLSAPALHALIQNNALIDVLVAGGVPEAARMTLMLADPSAMTTLAAPMTREAAAAFIAAMPPEVLSLVYPQVLDPVTVKLALLSAHMIIFWLSQDSNVTPPVCLTAFAAAAIAKTPPMATGLVSWKVAKGLYLMPILFAYTQFLGGPPLEVLHIFVIATVGVYALGAAIEGHMEAPLNWPVRILLFAAGVALIWPNNTIVETLGAVGVIAIFAWNVRVDRRRRVKAA